MVRQIAHLLIPPKEKRSVTLQVYVAEVSPEEEAERGLLFGLFHVDYPHHRNEEIVESIIEELEGRYYDDEGYVQEPEKLLEETLQALNTTLAHLIEDEQIFLNLKRFNAVIGMIRGRSLTFTHVGKVHAFLLHRGKTQTPRLTDILDTTEEKKTEKAPPVTRIFSQIVSGTLRTQDAVLFSTSSLLDYLTKEQIEKTLLLPPPTKALHVMKKLLKEGGNTLGIGALVLRLAPEHEIEGGTGARESLEALSTTEDDTESLLAPSLLKTVFRVVARTLTLLNRAGKKLFHIRDDASHREIAIEGLRLLFFLLRKTLHTLVFVLRTLWQLLSTLLEMLRPHGNWRAKLQTLKERSNAGLLPTLTKTKESFSALSLRHRTLVMAAVLLAVILLGSLSITGVQRSRERRTQEYQQSITRIRERITTAEASMIFKDEERTKTIYTEATALVQQLSRRTKEQRATVEELEKEIATRLLELRHVVPLERVDVLADFRELDPAVDTRTLITAGTAVYVAHGSRPLIYKINLENKQVVTLDASDIDVRNVEHLARKSDTELILAFANAGIAELNVEKGSVKPLDLTFGANGVTLSDIAIYNKRLYILDRSHNQVWRHDQTKSGFGRGVPWLNENVDFSRAQAFAIDGAVWMTEEEQVVQYLRGKKTSFALQGIDPKERRVKNIALSEEGNRIWLLDELGKRLLALEKDTGKLKAQYPLPSETEDIRDFALEKNSTILLLTKSRLLRLTYGK